MEEVIIIVSLLVVILEIYLIVKFIDLCSDVSRIDDTLREIKSLMQDKRFT